MKNPSPMIGSSASSLAKPRREAISLPIQNQIIVTNIIHTNAAGKKIFGIGKKDLNIKYILKINLKPVGQIV